MTEPRFRPILMTLCALLLVGACAPRLQEIGSSAVEQKLTNDAFIMPDGARLPLKSWTAKRPRAVIVGVHGMNDYSNAFGMPGPWFARQGITTYSYDQRGFGETDQRGVWAGAQVMADDLKSVVGLVKRRHPNLPVFVMGVSMGGAVSMKAMAQGMDVDGAILVAPAIWGWQAMNPLYKTGLWLGAHTMPWKKATGSGLDIWPSDNIEMLREFSKDPLVIKGTRIDAVYGLVTLMDDAYKAAPELEQPVLYLYGEKDQIVPSKPTLHVMSEITAPKRLVRYKNGWHMLLRDKQRKKVWRDALVWIGNHKAVLPSGEEFNPEKKLASAKP